MPAKFTGQIRQWDPSKPGGLHVVDVLAELVAALGGQRQMRVTGTINAGFGLATSGSVLISSSRLN